MTVKYHKKNTNFQTSYFLVGACHTVDTAYFQVLELKEDRLRALDARRASMLRMEAKKALAVEVEKNSPHEWDRLNAKADILECDDVLKYDQELYDACLDEIAHLERWLAKLEPKRKYKQMDKITAHEASQQEEWGLELKERAENFLLAEGRIPAGEYKTMRMHPDFQTLILPRIQEMSAQLQTQEGRLALEANIKQTGLLLEAPKQ